MNLEPLNKQKEYTGQPRRSWPGTRDFPLLIYSVIKSQSSRLWCVRTVWGDFKTDHQNIYIFMSAPGITRRVFPHLSKWFVTRLQKQNSNDNKKKYYAGGGVIWQVFSKSTVFGEGKKKKKVLKWQGLKFLLLYECCREPEVNGHDKLQSNRDSDRADWLWKQHDF